MRSAVSKKDKKKNKNKNKKKNNKRTNKGTKGQTKGQKKTKCLPCICSESCALSMTLCLTLKGCATHHATMCDYDRKHMLCKYDMWMVCGSNTPPDEGGQLPPPWRLKALPTHTQKVGSVKSTLSKTVRTRPLRSASAGRKVSTSSSSVSMSFIFLAIMDTLPHRQPQLSLGSSPSHYWLDLSTNSRSLG